MRTIIAALLCAVALLAADASRRAPGFSLPSSGDRQEDLADYRGKIVLIDIMKTDCAHCGPFARILQQAAVRYGNRVAVLSIAPAPDDPITVGKFIAENGVTYPILFDCGQVVYSYVQPNPLNPGVSLPHLHRRPGWVHPPGLRLWSGYGRDFPWPGPVRGVGSHPGAGGQACRRQTGRQARQPGESEVRFGPRRRLLLQASP